MKKFLLSLSFVLFLVPFATAQIPNYVGNCPGVPCINHIDHNLIPPIGNSEILLGEGVITRDNSGSGAYNFNNTIEFRWPCNKPTWPIATAHAWQLFRGTTGVTNSDINSYASIMINETAFACASDLDFSTCNPTRIVDANQVANNAPQTEIPLPDGRAGFLSEVGGVGGHDGCFQIDNLGRAALMEGTSACSTCGFYDDPVKTAEYITGDAYETAVIGRTYYDLIFYRKLQNVRGLDTKPVFNTTNDNYAATGLFAGAFNQGFNAMYTQADNAFGVNRVAAMASNDWLNGGILSPFAYSRACVHYNKILSNDYTPTGPNDLQQWLGWYDYDITWAIMDQYLTTVLPMHQLTAAEELNVRTQVQAVFDLQKNGAGTVSFRYKLGPVIDVMVSLLPYTDPAYNNTSSQDGVSTCSGCVGPYVTIQSNYTVPVCSGQSVRFETIFGDGYTYTWLKDDVIIANTNTEKHIFFATQSGTYSVVVEDEKSCAIRAEADVTIVVNNCSSCDLNVDLTITKNSCTDIGDGSLQAVLSGTSYSSGGSYVYEWINADGTTAVLTNGNHTGLIQGEYAVKVYESATPTCSAFTNVVIEETEIVYQKLDLTKVDVDCDKVDLTATVTGNPPRNCEYQIRIEGTPDGSGKCWGSTWQTTDARFNINRNGVSAGNRSPSASTVSGACEHLNETVGVSHGDTLDLIVKALSCNGTVNINKNFYITDPLGNEVTVNVGTLTQKGANVVLSTIVSCEQPVINYDLTWTSTPATGVLSNEVLNPNLATATATVTSGNSWVKAEGTTAGNNCVLVDSMLVKNLCPGACASPGMVSMEHNGTGITGTLAVCTSVLTGTGYTITSNQSGNDAGTFVFQLYKGGVAQTPTNATGNFTLTTAGTYYVEVKDANDNACVSQSNTVTLTATDVPLAPTFSTSVVSVCSGATGESYVVSAVADADDYTWSYSGTNASFNPATPTGTTATLDFATNATSGDVEITANNTCGSSTKTVVSVTVNSLPAAPTGSDITACKDGIAPIVNATGLGLQWYTAATGGVGSVTAPIVTTATAGTTKYYVSQTVNGCEGARKELNVTVTPLPSALTVTALSYCKDEAAAVLTATGAGLTWYTAVTGGTALATAPTPLTNTVTTLDYYVSQTVTSCEGPRANLQVTINALPTVTASASVTEVCDGESVILTGAGADSYTWDNGVTDNTAFSPTATVNYTVTGTNTATTCTNTASVQVEVNALPTVTTTVTGSPACLGANVTLTGGGATTYTWDNSVTNATAFATTAVGTTTYEVEGTDANGCKKKATVDVVVNALPTAVLTGTASICNKAGVTTDLNIALTGAQPWEVVYNNPITGNQTINPTSSPATVAVNNAGDYTLVSVKDANNCTATSATGTATIDYLDEVIATYETKCSGDEVGTLVLGGTDFQIVLTVTQGDLSSITATETTVHGVTFTREGTTNQWVSGAIDESNTVVADIKDVNDCNTLTRSGMNTRCSCPATGTTVIGTGGLLTETICNDAGVESTVTVTYNGGSSDYRITLDQPTSADVIKDNETGTTTFAVSEAGTYNVEIYSNGNACPVNGGSVTLGHHTTPVAQLSATSATTVCAGDNVTLEVKLTAGDAPFTFNLDNTTPVSSVAKNRSNNNLYRSYKYNRRLQYHQCNRQQRLYRNSKWSG